MDPKMNQGKGFLNFILIFVKNIWAIERGKIRVTLFFVFNTPKVLS